MIVSLLIPTNRPNWKPWVQHQVEKLVEQIVIRGKKSIVIEVLFDESDKTIGKKRNDLCHRARGDYLVFLDDDDWQDPGRVIFQVSLLKETGKSLTFCDPCHNYDLRTGQSFLSYGPSEGCFCFTKEFFRKSAKFCEDAQPGEGAQFIRGHWKDTIVSRGKPMVVLFNHGDNTVERENKSENEQHKNGSNWSYELLTTTEKEILSSC